MKYLNFANPVSGNRQPEFLMTLIDLSPSMDDDDWKPSRKAGAIKANIELLKLKAQYYPQDIVGVICFGGNAKLLRPPARLNNGINDLSKSLENVHVSYGTNFTAALKIAEDCFFGRYSFMKNTSASKRLLEFMTKLFYESVPNTYLTQGKSNVNKRVTKRIIMLTDGEHNAPECPVKVATRLKNASVLIDCIGIGGSPCNVDEKLLKEIASRDRNGQIRYCFIGDKQLLIKKYESLSHHIKPA